MTDELANCTEICDGKDNDGDGTVDNNLTDAAPSCWSFGVCAAGGAATCAGVAGWTCAASAPASYQRVESLCDGLDNDCDGAVDETCSPCATVQRVCTVAWVTSSGHLRCAAADGSNPVSLVQDLPATVGDFYLDQGAGKLYLQAANIRRSNLDGTAVEVLKASVWQGAPIAVDAGAQWLYWGDASASIWRKALPSGAESAVITAFPTAGALEVKGGQLYYGSISGARSITRANLDGSGKQILLTDGLGDPFTVIWSRTASSTTPWAASCTWSTSTARTIARFRCRWARSAASPSPSTPGPTSSTTPARAAAIPPTTA